ncbi:chondroitin AC/alginate lyase [Rhizoctonia solani]|nr:chondroitin AC/alginate lyase [Rhizoctonia solani]
MAWFFTTVIPLQLLGSIFLGIVHASDVDTIYTRQVEFIISTTPVSSTKIKNYVNTLKSDGSWSAIDYSAGCTARRSSWPAGGHWTRLLEMAVAYHGGVARYKHNADLRSAIQKAMGYWFANDYSVIGDGSCIDREFLKINHCPCGTPGLWGPNWYSNVIQVPSRSGKVCVLLRSELTSKELAMCTLMTARAYAPFYRDPQPGYLSGANVMDIAVIGILAGLLENNRAGNASRIADAYQRVHPQALVQSVDRVDGIKPDGSFQQHGGIIYNGNYGKDFSNSFMELELQALGTQFQADKKVQDSFARFFSGGKWMTYTNVMSKVVHWDLTVIGRFVSYPVVDGRASANLRMDLSHVLKLGNAWSQKDLIEFGSKLTGSGDNSANSGGLIGTRMFWNSDYLVHRTADTVSTVKMVSSRTTTSECVNSENPFGFHLSDGLVYTYSTGAEYEDTFAALDYNIPPGITTEYAAIKLECKTTTRAGVDKYAGGVQADDVGMAAMRYVNPLSKSFGFYKAWFFFPDNVQHVLVSNIQQPSRSTTPVFSVLDQRLRSGNIYLNGELLSSSGNFTEANTLWHGGTGYIFPPDQALSTRVTVSLQTRTGDWSKISTSKQPLSVKDMFTAWIIHTRSGGISDPHYIHDSNAFPPVEYSVFPATRSNSEFANKARGLRPRTVINSELVSAAMDSHAKMLGAAFWKSSGGAVSVKEMGIRVEVDRGVVVMLKFDDDARTKGTIYVAEPTHGTGRVTVKITHLDRAMHQRHKGDGCFGHNCSTAKRVVESRNADVTLNLDLPGGGMAGSTVVKKF